MSIKTAANRSTIFLIAFALLYTAITIYFIYDIKRDESASIAYLFLFPLFWLVAGIILRLLFWLNKIELKNTIDHVAMFFSTPLPMLGFFCIWSVWSYSQSSPTNYEYNNNGHRHRETKYQFQNGHLDKVEYYISRDTVTEENPFPKTDCWLKDSTWTYYKSDGTIDHQEKY